MEPDHDDFSTVITNAVTASVASVPSDQLSPPHNTPDPVADRPELNLDDEENVVLTMSEAVAPEGKSHAASTSTEVATADIYPPAPVLNIRNPSRLPSSTNNDLITITDSPPTTPTGHGNVHGQPPPPLLPSVAVVGASASLNAARTASMSSSRGGATEGGIDRERTSPPRTSKSCPTCTIM